MKKALLLVSVVSLTACMGNNDGYTQRDVWEQDGVIHGRADANEKTETLCFNKAKMNARDKVSNYLVNGYSGTDKLTIDNEKESFNSNRISVTESLFKGASYLLKPYDKKTRVCGVEIMVPKDEAEALLNN